MVPSYKLFLSVDLIGSTALKQKKSPYGESREHDAPAKQAARSFSGDDWFFFVADFYTKFQTIFVNELRYVLEADDNYCSSRDGERPCSKRLDESRIRRWKLAGDEIIYSIDIYNQLELICLITAFSNAIVYYRKVSYFDKRFFKIVHGKRSEYEDLISEQYKYGTLDVKGCAWCAGFPVTNKEIVLPSDLGKLEYDLESSDPIHRNFYLMHLILNGDVGDTSNLIFDYVGPSIDTGFRLTDLATPRKLILSVETAYLITSAGNGQRTRAVSSEASVKKNLKFGFDRRTSLKGVIGGNSYPIFWIDTASDEGLSSAEDEIFGTGKGIDYAKVVEFCTRFFERHNRYLRTPQILDPLDKYDAENSLCRIVQHADHGWKQEKSRISSRFNIRGG